MDCYIVYIIVCSLLRFILKMHKNNTTVIALINMNEILCKVSYNFVLRERVMLVILKTYIVKVLVS